ncbi:probable LRR receptor-like serine/threonine-protein kinase At1g05700 [Macadamia integrifolia]|uniref:probable LRR receptor-like serine/threonine-protein kinase At1g05700 n=1 Tax=Macadamia integrifolia TaxID=60698 RepID=UPI001C4FCF16|nr:probable LRR receptor-like serine/threonine-protein kinase At1g05700 [Macadamia integrifolia]
MSTLRVFSTKKSPPTFDIQLDGNHWSTVFASSKDLIYVEAIYVAKKDTISVCLAQTQPNQLPFISSLEVRNLDSSMYKQVDSNYALFLTRRAAFGTNKTIRYPDDVYDRIWVGATGRGNGVVDVTSDILIIDTALCLDFPPTTVLRNALTTENIPILFLGTHLPITPVPFYINMYFLELYSLDYNTQLRSFTIDMDSSPINPKPIFPYYGAGTEIYIVNGTASSNDTFALVSTNNSTLPPLINAMEVFIVSGPLTDGTNSDDVQQLSLLQTQFSVLAEWSGDPCLPAPYTWEWVACTSDAMPRITALLLSGFGLSGTLPDFSSMVALQTIDLHNNSLTGEIPSFLGDLPYLKELNLADNELSGTVPISLSKKKFKLDVSGNQKLCASCVGSGPSSSPSTSSSGKKGSNLAIILGVTIPAFIVLLVIVALVAVTYHRRKTAAITSMDAG